MLRGDAKWPGPDGCQPALPLIPQPGPENPALIKAMERRAGMQSSLILNQVLRGDPEYPALLRATEHRTGMQSSLILNQVLRGGPEYPALLRATEHRTGILSF